MLKTTLFTYKPRRSFPVRFASVTALKTLLARVSRINIFDGTSLHPGFVIQKSLKSTETPGVQTSPLFFPSFNSFSDICEIFQNDNCTFFNTVNNSSRKYVIAILAETVDFSTYLFKVCFSRLSAFRLQVTFQIEVLFLGIFPATVAKKLTMTCDGWAINSEIDAYYITVKLERFVLFFNYDVKVNTTLLSENEISRTYLPVYSILVIFGDFKIHVNSSVHRSDRSFSIFQIDVSRPSIVSNCKFISLRALCFPFLFKLSFCRLEGFGSFDTSRTHKLTRKIRLLSFRIVCKFMKFNSVERFSFPAYFADIVERIAILLCGFLNILNSASFDRNFDSHLHCLTYMVLNEDQEEAS